MQENVADRVYRNRLHSVGREYRAGLKSFSEEEIMTGIQKKQRLLTMIFGAFAIFLPDIPMYGLFTSPM